MQFDVRCAGMTVPNAQSCLWRGQVSRDRMHAGAESHPMEGCGASYANSRDQGVAKLVQVLAPVLPSLRRVEYKHRVAVPDAVGGPDGAPQAVVGHLRHLGRVRLGEPYVRRDHCDGGHLQQRLVFTVRAVLCDVRAGARRASAAPSVGPRT